MEKIWKKVKSSIQTTVPSHSYRMWIEPLGVLKENKNTLTLFCPNIFFKKKVTASYRALIESELSKIAGKKFKVMFEVVNNHAKRPVHNPLEPSPQRALPSMSIKPFSGRYLRKDFNFDNFVVGPNCQLSYSASLALANTMGSNGLNSLYLHSDTGNGKSHLSQAVGNFIIQNSPEERVFYITAEDFMNEMIGAYKGDSITLFKDKYRNGCDVLLIEDVQYLQNKEKTQIELALTLDSLMDANKKIIFTSSHLPNKIPKIDDSLKSRLSSGLISDILPPDFKTRMKILKKKSLASGSIVPVEVLEYLASELNDNVRQLESGLIGVTAKATLLGIPLDRNLAESVVKNIVVLRKKLTLETIKKLVGKHYNLSMSDLASKSRKQGIVVPRQIAMYLSRKHTDNPLQAIGQAYNRYHATALYAVRAIENEIISDGSIRSQVEILSKEIDRGNF